MIRLPIGLDYSRYGKISEIVDCMNDNGMVSSGRFLNASYVSIDLSKEDVSQNGHHLSAANMSHRKNRYDLTQNLFNIKT
jgi:hypothetical protein